MQDALTDGTVAVCLVSAAGGSTTALSAAQDCTATTKLQKLPQVCVLNTSSMLSHLCKGAPSNGTTAAVCYPTNYAHTYSMQIPHQYSLQWSRKALEGQPETSS